MIGIMDDVFRCMALWFRGEWGSGRAARRRP